MEIPVLPALIVPASPGRWIAPLILALAGLAIAPGDAQTMRAPVVGQMSATQVGVEPAMKVPTARYVAETDALDAWAVAASGLAAGRSHDARVLAFAREAGATHLRLLRSRGGPPARLPALAAMLDRLRATRGVDFDRLFATDQIAAQRRLWSLHSGYAADGPDQRLRDAAAATVPIEERELHALPLRPMPY